VEHQRFTFAKPVPCLSGPDLHKLGYMRRKARRVWQRADRKRLEHFFKQLANDNKSQTIPLNENQSVYTFISRKVLDSSYSDEEVRSMILHYFKVLQISKKHLNK
jgi:transposase